MVPIISNDEIQRIQKALTLFCSVFLNQTNMDKMHTIANNKLSDSKIKFLQL